MPECEDRLGPRSSRVNTGFTDVAPASWPHGPPLSSMRVSTVELVGRSLGQWRAIQVRSCNECAKRVKQRRQPDALHCREHGREIPYYEADPKHSVWAATGYGQFSDNLIERVLAGHGGHTDPDS